MARFVASDIVVVLFPFTDLSLTRKRPVLVLANLEGDDLVIRQKLPTRRKNDQRKILDYFS